MKKIKLDKYEKDVLKSYEGGEWKLVPNQKQELERIRQISRNTLARNKAINIRISAPTLHKLRTKAAEKGLPYQTLIASILHQYNG